MLRVMVIIFLISILVACQSMLMDPAGVLKSECNGYGKNYTFNANATDCERTPFKY